VTAEAGLLTARAKRGRPLPRERSEGGRYRERQRAAPTEARSAEALTARAKRVRPLPRERSDRGLTGERSEPAYSRSSRSAFAMTMSDAPMSAATAIHSVAVPATAMIRNAAFSTIENEMFA